MKFDKDVPVPMSDGLVLRANVYRPDTPGRYPVLLAQGVYAKDVHFRDAFSAQWTRLLALYPGLCSDGSSGDFLRWEIVDPERWVPDGYVVIQVDARGSGKSPGYLDAFSPREIQDYYEAIEWAGVQSWSSGKVGIIGVSYYAITQWLVAALQPPHLAAMVPWEGASDHYREWAYHGGLLSSGFLGGWWPRQVIAGQHGNGASAYRDPITGERTTGEPIDPALLEGNRARYMEVLASHPLLDEWHRERSPRLEQITVPVLSAGNWGGPGVHLRGNIEGFLRAGSQDKWLSMHTGTHFESFYLPDYVAMQKRFFEHFLKGVDNGWEKEPRVQLSIRRPDGFTRRMEHEFPLARTQAMPWALNAVDMTLSSSPDEQPAQSCSYLDSSEGVSFTSAPFELDCEFTGYMSLHLWVASSATDLDLFVTLRLLDPTGAEVFFEGAHEAVPVARGWLRASHRALDPERSTPLRPVHTHLREEKLKPGEGVALDVEIWPTSMVVPKGYRLMLTLAGRDFELPGKPGRILHQTLAKAGAQAAVQSIFTGGATPSYLLLPLIPSEV